jgi:8-oxo-dGTP pyrophosphatase MutT (NUDIX family)
MNGGIGGSMANINQLVQEAISIKDYRQRVEVAVFKDNEILITIITPYPPKVTEPYFGMPGGGIKIGDTPIETCKKECLEEVAVKIKNIKKIPISPFKFNWEDKKIINTHTLTGQKLLNRQQQYKGTITTYYTADFDGYDYSKFGADHDSLKYKFVTLPAAIELITDRIKHHEDPKNIPIFKYRLKVLKFLNGEGHK